MNCLFPSTSDIIFLFKKRKQTSGEKERNRAAFSDFFKKIVPA